MQAVILVGGEGTRLRPLTSLQPKPIITLVDRPFMAYMLEWLRGHGVEDVILSCGFLPTKIEDTLGDGSSLGIRLRYVTEPEPRGTAGALKYAEDLLEDRFLLLNGDVLTDVELQRQLRQHEDSGAAGTLALVPVEDPSAYGLVLLDEDDSVRGFLEKPGPDELAGVSDYLISAGIYVLERAVLDLIPPDRNVSIEREIWPALVGNGLYGHVARDAYWMDIGTPERYLQGTFDILEGNVRTAVLERLGADHLALGEGVRAEGRIVPPAVVGRDCVIGRDANVGSLVVLGPGVTVGAGSRVERAVVLDGAHIGDGCELTDCVVGPGARVGEHTVISGGAVLGEGVVVGRGNVLTGGMKVFPGTVLAEGTVN